MVRRIELNGRNLTLHSPWPILLDLVLLAIMTVLERSPHSRPPLVSLTLHSTVRFTYVRTGRSVRLLSALPLSRTRHTSLQHDRGAFDILVDATTGNITGDLTTARIGYVGGYALS